MARQTIEIVAVDKTQRALNNIQQNVSGLNRGFGAVTKAAGAFIAVLGAREVIEFGARIKDAAAQFQNYRNQLRLVTTGSQDLERVFGVLTQAAIENRTSFAETVDLFTKLRVSTENLGVSEERVIAVTGKLSQALQVAGADGNTAASVIRQFGQAMASGEVRGDEFRSLVEGLGPALAVMARESGITVGELRAMSQAGELTAETLFKMLENSNSLTAAFNQMQPTINQLETELSDAFDRALDKLGEVTGFTKAYEKNLADLTRTFNNFAGTNELAGKSSEEIFKMVEDGSLNATKGAEELISRYRDLDNTIRVLGFNLDIDLGFEDLIGTNEEVKDSLAETINRIYALRNAQAETAKETEKAAEKQAELNKSINAAIEPFRGYINLAEKYETSGFGSALDKNEEKIRKVNEALLKLKEANNTVIEATGKKVLSDERLAELSRVLNLELAALTEQNKKLKDAQNDVTSSGLAYGDFLTDTIQKMNESVKLDQFKQQAITDISAKYRDGTYTLEQYNAAMGALDSTFETSAEKQKTANEELIEQQTTLKNDVMALTEAYRQHFSTKTDDANHAFNNEIAKLKEAYAIQAIDLQTFNDMKVQAEEVLQSKLDSIREEAAKKEAARQEALFNKNLNAFQQGKFGEIDMTKMSEEQKLDFLKKSGRVALDQLAQHSKEAFQLAKAASIAEAIINTAQGVTKALAQGGIFGPILAGVILASGAAQIATIRSQTYQGRQRGGVITAGQSTIVGEDGPELIVPKQPSTVIPREVAQAIEGMGGNGGPVTVNFNIETVDAQGFDQLLVSRRGTITNIINGALQQRGKEGIA